MLNRIVLIGRLTRDPEQSYATSGVAIAKFSVAVDRPIRNENGERDTDFIDCVAFKQRAEFLHKYARKGRLVAVEGRLQIRQWQAQDGSKRRSAEVVADNVELLDRAREPGDEDGGGGSAGGYGGPAGGFGQSSAPRPPMAPPPTSIDDHPDPFGDE
ncbi:MAG: single-stranded DNA-binding protein [Armatimonadetes bacterium]|nr:single-stranded DNA-binding protein [Armatimonadota bacterium]